jgi:PKD repeat protein
MKKFILILMLFALARGGTAQNLGLTATSAHSGGGASATGYGPELYNNNVIPVYGTGGTFLWGWVTGGGWIEYTWTSPQNINKVVFYKDTRQFTSMNIEYWNGSGYTTILSGYTGTSAPADSVTFTAVTTTKLRFNNVAGSNPNHREIEVYGPVTTGPGVSIPPIASFAYTPGVDTVWLNSQRIFVNTSNNSVRNYWDITGFSATGPNGPFTYFNTARECNLEGCYIDTLHQNMNFRWTFNTRGWYRVKLKAQNDYGSDSIEKIVYADFPTRKPVANFFTDRRVLGFYDPSFFYDLSLYGPTEWEWYLNPAYIGNSGAGPNTFTNNDGTTILNFSAQNPMFNPADGGEFDVCLRVSNIRGSDTLCRKDYIRVTNSFSMCTGGSDSVSTLNEGYLFDQGGAINPYLPSLTDDCKDGFRIAPCADSVVLHIERFRLRNTDSVTIRNGGGPTSPILRRIGGANLPDSLRTWVGTSGQLFIQMTASPPSGAGDSGFVFYWTSKAATYGAPKAAFSAPDTIYSGYTVTYNNQSTGNKVGFNWDTNGDGVYLYDSTVKHATQKFITSTPVTRNICLVAMNCRGTDTVCKSIVIMPVSQKPKADFTVNRTSGFTTDTFRFTDLSRNGANKWLWTFTPNIVGFINGTTVNSQNPVLFLNSATSYTVRLIATNSAGSDTIEKISYTTAIAYNSPYTENPIPPGLDIGISRVVLNEIDTTTPLASPVYHALYNNKQTTLYRGVDYTVRVYRATNNDPQSMKVWIDYNRNTQFGDAPNETLINEVSQFKVVSSQTFRIPNNSPLGNTRMRIGVSYDNSTLRQDYAGIGVFEDYGIIIGHDAVKPVVTLVGNTVFKTEVNKPFVDPGATAIDNLEGSISVTVKGTVDNTKLGYYTLTYTATDLYGNVSEPVIRLVQVEINQTGPVITLNGSDSIMVPVFTSFTDPGATAVDNTGLNITNLITVSGQINTDVIGLYSRTYSVTDAFGFTGMKVRKVNVVDNQAPVIHGNIISRHQIGQPFVDPVSVTDNYWPAASVTLKRTGTVNVNVPGNYVVTYNATDGSGNMATPFTTTVQVGDMVPPVIVLNGLSEMELDVHTTFIDPGVTVSDNYYPNVVVNKTSNLQTSVLGSYTITYTALDGGGNTASVSRTVQVVDRIAPNLSLLGEQPYNLTRYQPYIEGGYQVTDNYYQASVLTVTVDASKVINHKPGSYYVKYTATDPSGNTRVVSRLVVVSEEGAVGIAEESNIPGLSLYPNPASDVINLSWDATNLRSIKVYSLTGREVAAVSISSSQRSVAVDIRQLPQGMYFVRMETTTGSAVKKVNIVR